MTEENIVYIIFSLIFIAGTIYNYKKRKECIYPIRQTRPRRIIIGIIPIVFLAMAYFVASGSLYDYILAILASIFLIFSILAGGIHKEGIYHHNVGVRILIPRLARWEDIKDVKINMKKNKLESFKFKRKTIYPDQYYDSKDIREINKYIKSKIRNK